MATKQLQQAQNPLILRCNRIMEAFAKSDDERDFFLDRQEGFLIYVDLDKPDEDLVVLEKELERNKDRYCMIPKLTFYETKKIMEGFINEKVYDIDTKEKLLDIIQSKEARENFLEFIHDHHSEQEKWQTYYQERSRIRIIEWLRTNNFHFVFEEDLEMPRLLIEKLKKELFETRVGKDVANARKILFAKAKTYYSNEALNPRPKRGRPPKQALKVEIEPQITTDIYTTVPKGLLGFLFIPDLSSSAAGSFSAKFGHEDAFTSSTSSRRSGHDSDTNLESLNAKLQELRALSSKWINNEEPAKGVARPKAAISAPLDEEEDDFDLEEEDEEEEFVKPAKNVKPATKTTKAVPPPKKAPPAKASVKPAPMKSPPPAKGKAAASKSKPVIKKPAPQKVVAKQPPVKGKTTKPVAKTQVKTTAKKKAVPAPKKAPVTKKNNHKR